MGYNSGYISGQIKKLGPGHYRIWHRGKRVSSPVPNEDRSPDKNYCDLCGRVLNKNNTRGSCSICVRRLTGQ